MPIMQYLYQDQCGQSSDILSIQEHIQAKLEFNSLWIGRLPASNMKEH